MGKIDLIEDFTSALDQGLFDHFEVEGRVYVKHDSPVKKDPSLSLSERVFLYDGKMHVMVKDYNSINGAFGKEPYTLECMPRFNIPLLGNSSAYFDFRTAGKFKANLIISSADPSTFNPVGSSIEVPLDLGPEATMTFYNIETIKYGVRSLNVIHADKSSRR